MYAGGRVHVSFCDCVLYMHHLLTCFSIYFCMCISMRCVGKCFCMGVHVCMSVCFALREMIQIRENGSQMVIQAKTRTEFKYKTVAF